MTEFRGYVDPQWLDLAAAALRQDKERTYTAMHLQPGQAVLDVGCGPGGWTLCRANQQVTTPDLPMPSGRGRRQAGMGLLPRVA